GIDVVGVEELGLVLRMRRRLAALVAGAEEDRLDEVEVAFGCHPIEQHGPHHAAPADQSRAFHLVRPVFPNGLESPARRLGRARRDERARASAWWWSVCPRARPPPHRPW